jgi:hypothetical protein
MSFKKSVLVSITIFLLMSIPIMSSCYSVYRTRQDMVAIGDCLNKGMVEEAENLIEKINDKRMLSHDRTTLMLFEIVTKYYKSSQNNEIDVGILDQIEEIRKRDLISDEEKSLDFIELSIKTLVEPREAIALAKEMQNSSLPFEMNHAVKLMELVSIVSVDNLSKEDVERAEELFDDEDLNSLYKNEIDPIKRYWPLIKSVKGHFSLRALPEVARAIIRLILDWLKGDNPQGSLMIKG